MKKHAKEQVEATANAIVQQFVPKDPMAQQFSFHFTIPPSSNYRVDYQKDQNGNWTFIGYEADPLV